MNICYKCLKAVQDEEMVSGLHSSCFSSWFSVEGSQEFLDVVARSEKDLHVNERWEEINSSFFHGKFRKYSAHLGGKAYLLKVKQHEFPELPATEYTCNQLAREMGVEVPDHFLILFQNKLETFVSVNFMQEYPGSDLVHIWRYLESPSHYDCEHLLKIIEKEVGTYEAIARFVELCLFDSLIGNHDRHGRNLAFIRSAKNIRLAPFYDNPSYLGLEIQELLAAFHEPRGAIGTKATRDPLIQDYVKEWFRLGFAKEVVAFINKININNVEMLISESFISNARKEAVLKLILRRYKEMQYAV